jgi:fibronectin type 3 domain-containing protein
MTVTVPTGLALGAHTITIGGMSGTPLTVGNFDVTSTGGTVPAAPTVGTPVVVSATAINVSWAAVTGATAYNVYRSTTSPVAISAGNRVTTPPVGDTAFADSVLTASTTYYYRVTAINATGESAGSAEVSATTGAGGGAGSGISFSNSTPGAINLPGSSITFNQAGYGVLSSPTVSLTLNVSGDVLTVATVSSIAASSMMNAGNGSCVITNTTLGLLQPCSNYGVVFNRTAGTVSFSATPMKSVLGGAAFTMTGSLNFTPTPASPTGMTATVMSSTAINLSWNAVNGATSYNVYRSTSAGQAPASMTLVSANQTGLSYADTGLTASTMYYYKVTAVNGVGSGAATAEVSAQTNALAIGDTWVYRTLPATKPLMGIVWSGTQFVAVGKSGFNTGESTVLSSPDGITWTSRSTTLQADSLAWSGTKFMTSSLASSTDGVTWVQEAPAVLGSLAITWSGTQFVAVGQNGYIQTSPNGVAWTKRTSGTNYPLFGIAGSSTKLVAVGDLGNIVTSPDGIVWTPLTGVTTLRLSGIVWSGTQFVAVGASGIILTSPDGATWTPRASGTGSGLYGVAWSGTQFVAVGGSGTILTSPDGISWTSKTSGGVDSLTALAWSGTKFVVAGSGVSGGVILTSP